MGAAGSAAAAAAAVVFWSNDLLLLLLLLVDCGGEAMKVLEIKGEEVNAVARTGEEERARGGR